MPVCLMHYWQIKNIVFNHKLLLLYQWCYVSLDQTIGLCEFCYTVIFGIPDDECHWVGFRTCSTVETQLMCVKWWHIASKRSSKTLLHWFCIVLLFKVIINRKLYNLMWEKNGWQETLLYSKSWIIMLILQQRTKLTAQDNKVVILKSE